MGKTIAGKMPLSALPDDPVVSYSSGEKLRENEAGEVKLIEQITTFKDPSHNSIPIAE